MGLRELKNQILYEIKKMEEFPSEIQEIEPSETIEAKLEKDTPGVLEPYKRIELVRDVKQEIKPSEIAEKKLEKDTPESLELDKKIKLAKDIKQVLKSVVHHLEPEYFPQKSYYPLKDASRLFNKFDVKRVSEKSKIKVYKEYNIPTGLKLKFGVVKKYSEEDKPKEDFVYQPEVEKSLESVIKKDVFTIKGMPEYIKKENEVKKDINNQNEGIGPIIDKKKEMEMTKKGESKDNSESQMDEKENTTKKDNINYDI